MNESEQAATTATAAAAAITIYDVTQSSSGERYVSTWSLYYCRTYNTCDYKNCSNTTVTPCQYSLNNTK